MPISTDMKVRIAHADIALHTAFPRSTRSWQNSAKTDRSWQTRSADCPALLIGENDAVVIDGNCSNRVSAPDGGVIHIYGDLTSAIDAAGHYEIIVTGDVSDRVTIDAAGFCHVFVGGEFKGELRSTDSTKLWIGGDFGGCVKTGTPSTQLHIGGDYRGSILPGERAALLWMTVDGFASQVSMTEIAECGYTEFHASISCSDVAPGIYPLQGHHRRTSRGNSFNRWSVAANRAQDDSG